MTQPVKDKAKGPKVPGLEGFSTAAASALFSVGTAKDRVMGAEGLRLNRDSKAAALAFLDIIEDLSVTGITSLQNEQQRWVEAHCGAAYLDWFAPHTDTENRLDDAEIHLRKALGIQRPDQASDPLDAVEISSTSVAKQQPALAWKWARLGELFRVKGNLPPFCITQDHGQLLLMLRGNNQYYAKSEKCFRLARYYRDEYPWASAHLGAMLINKRRYNETKSTVSEAYQLLEQALKRHGYRYGWALFYQGGARFLTIATNLIDEINRGQLPPNGEDSSEYQGLLMGYSMVIALTDDASSFFSHPFHPGAIGSDEYLTLCYDLLDFLPTLDRQGTTKEAYLAYLKILIDAMVAGFNFMRTDEFVPGSETIRFLYAYLYVFFLAENAAANVGNDPATWRRTLVPLFQKGYQQLDLSVDLRRVAPSSSAAAGQATAFSGNPMDIVDLLNSLLTNLATTSIPRLQSAQLELQREGVLLRLFDLMMIAAKLGVIEKVWGRPTKDTELVVDQLEKVIPVLKLAGGRQTIDEVHRLVTKADDGWLLTPQWVPDLEPKRRKALEAFLKVTNMKEPIMEDSLMGGAV